MPEPLFFSALAARRTGSWMRQRRFLGHGVGLRRDHFERVLSAPTGVDWFEAISENFMVPGGRPRDILRRVRRDYPIVLHGVSLSIGSTDPLDGGYLERLAALIRDIEPAWVTDHLCWTGVSGVNSHDLLPMPYTEEALDHVARRVAQVQERLGRRIALENPSSYLTWTASTIPEWDFLAALAARADCGIMLDVNNVFVSARNHGFDPEVYIDAIPTDRVWQFHLAGHSDHGTHLLDTHDHPVRDEVWELYRRAVRRFGTIPTLIEWDGNVPPWERLEAESHRAREVMRDALAP
jgi:uncharacterized protein (UPF0276 family)